MRLRATLAALIVLATVGFVVGTSVERGSGEAGHEAATTPAAGESAERGAEGATGHAVEERADEADGTGTAPGHGSELRPLGVDVEAVPVIVLAATVSLALALAAWLRPGSHWLLLAVGAAMAAFAVLDDREVVHQADEGRTGLAVLAGAVAGPYGAAAVVAVLLTRRARSPRSGPSAPAANMGA